MQARAYLLKACQRDDEDAPIGALAEGAEFASPSPGVAGVWVATRSGEAGEPAWAELVREATEDEIDLETRTAPGAAVLVDVDGSDQLVAFCFGSGRYLLRRSSYVLGFGMRTALNAAVASGADAVESIAWVSFRTTDAAPVDGRLRASVPKALVGYGVTPGIDRVRGVRVQRLAQHVGVGRNLEGATSLGLDMPGNLATLPPLAARLHGLGVGEEFRQAWPHVDDLIAVEDSDQRAELDAALEARLVARALDGIFLGIPDEAEGFGTVTYGASQEPHEGFDLAAALDGWRGSIGSLRTRSVTFVFGDGRPNHIEHLHDLLVTTELLDGVEVHLTDGDWFEVRAELLAIIDDALDAIPDWDIELPEWDHTLNEGDYLLGAAADRADLLLMDRKNVLVGGGTQMEVCDLAHVGGAMVHVKKRDTKGLSHLAAQVLGSATRWSRERGYRDGVVEKMQYQAAQTQKDPAPFAESFEPSVARQALHPQVLAIGAERGDRTLAEVVTTLAKVQLHRTCTELSSRGFDVRLARANRTA